MDSEREPVCVGDFCKGHFTTRETCGRPLAAGRLLTEQINAAPEPLRSYVHHLATDADPAGDKFRLQVAEENVAMPGVPKKDHDSPPDAEAPPKASCGGCRFYLITATPTRGGPSGGECRRDTPRIDSDGLAAWPMLASNCVGCGEFDWAEEPESEAAADLRRASDGFDALLKREGPALPPRECPCLDGKLRPGMKQHLTNCPHATRPPGW